MLLSIVEAMKQWLAAAKCHEWGFDSEHRDIEGEMFHLQSCLMPAVGDRATAGFPRHAVPGATLREECP